MMKKPISYRAFGIGTLVLTLLAALLRSLAFATSFDRTVGYFDQNVFSTLLYIVIMLALIGVAAFALTHRRNAQDLPCPARGERSVCITICSLLIAVTLAVCAVLDLLAIANDHADTLFLLRMIAAVLAIPYFAFPNNRRILAFGLGAHAYCLLVVISEYFDRYVPMNSPLKLMQQFSLIVFILYLLSEMFCAIGQPRPVRTTAFAAVAFFLCTTNGISCIVAAIAGGMIPSDYLMGAILSLSFGLYAAAWLYTAIMYSHTNETEVS